MKKKVVRNPFVLPMILKKKSTKIKSKNKKRLRNPKRVDTEREGD